MKEEGRKCRLWSYLAHLGFCICQLGFLFPLLLIVKQKVLVYVSHLHDSRNVVSGSTVKSIKSASYQVSGEMRRVCFPYPVVPLSTDIFSVKEIFHFPHLPAADKNATVIFQKYFYCLTNSSEQIPSNKEALLSFQPSVPSQELEPNLWSCFMSRKRGRLLNFHSLSTVLLLLRIGPAFFPLLVMSDFPSKPVKAYLYSKTHHHYRKRFRNLGECFFFAYWIFFPAFRA